MTTMSRRVMTILCVGLMAFIAIQSIEARSEGDHDFSSTRKLLGQKKKEIKLFKKARNEQVKALKQQKKTDNKVAKDQYKIDKKAAEDKEEKKLAKQSYKDTKKANKETYKAGKAQADAEFKVAKQNIKDGNPPPLPTPIDPIGTGCPAGEGILDGGDTCQACVGDTISPADSNTCTTCPNGEVANAAKTACEAPVISGCPAGEGIPDGGDTCQPCAGDTISPGDNSVCTACPNGEVANEEKTACFRVIVLCPAGFGSDDDSTCLPCPDGEVSPADNNICTPCPNGEFPNADKSACEALVIATCPAGEGIPDGGDTCQPCPGDTISPGDDSVCTACPFNEVANEEKTTCLFIINLCPAGEGSDDGTTCVPCAADEVSPVDNNICTPCPNGQVPNADQSACVLGI